MVFLDTFLAQLNLFYMYPPFGLEAHSQIPRHDPVPLGIGDEGVQPIQQQLSHGWFSKVLDAAIQLPLEGVRVIGLQCCHQFCQQEKGDAGVLKHWSDVIA